MPFIRRFSHSLFSYSRRDQLLVSFSIGLVVPAIFTLKPSYLENRLSNKHKFGIVLQHLVPFIQPCRYFCHFHQLKNCVQLTTLDLLILKNGFVHTSLTWFFFIFYIVLLCLLVVSTIGE